MIPNAPDLSKMVPGFDFLQGLVKNAGSVLPGMGQWVAPTLDPVELEKRIDELRTVQFWLEQNARMIGTTIQALEVQRMTLSTLQTMNVQVADLRDAMRIQLPETAPPAPMAVPDPVPAAPPAAAPAGVVDPTQWWSALTKQFTELAAHAVRDAAAVSATEASRKAAAKAAPRQAARPPAKKKARRAAATGAPRRG